MESIWRRQAVAGERIASLPRTWEETEGAAHKRGKNREAGSFAWDNSQLWLVETESCLESNSSSTTITKMLPSSRFLKLD
jgi:hypothetical protein